jgi:hypothetical protein
MAEGMTMIESQRKFDHVISRAHGGDRRHAECRARSLTPGKLP